MREERALARADACEQGPSLLQKLGGSDGEFGEREFCESAGDGR